MDNRDYLDCKDDDYLSCVDDDYLSCGDDTVVTPPVVDPVTPTPTPTPAPKPRKDDDIVYELFYGLIAFLNNVFAKIRGIFKR